MRILVLTTAALLLATLAGCGGNPRRPVGDAEKLYDMGKHASDNGNYKDAITYYEQLEARFPFSNPARQGQLDLMYAYYKNREPESAIDQADQFIRENPAHPRVDYAYYIKGLTQFERNPNFLERWFNADLSQRPPIDARKSFQAFQTILERYPNSEYADDARKRMIFLRNRLASYEVYVADYYLKRGAYVEKGMKIGYVTDYFGKVISEARTPSAGVILYVCSVPSMKKDDTVAYVGEITSNQ